MLTSDLLDRIQGFHEFGETKTNVSPDDVYRAAIFAQKEILESIPLLENTVGMTLLAGKERYSYSIATITAASNTTPIVITTASAHGFSTGDTLSIANVVGNSAANADWPIIVLSPTTFSLTGSAGNGAWTSGGTATHLLCGAVNVRLIRLTVSPYGWLRKVSQRQVERDRMAFLNGASPATVNRYYIIRTDPITIGVQGVPTANLTAEITYQRIPIPDEDITSTQNPILPSQYDKLLYVGTLYHIIDSLDRDWAVKRSLELEQKFEREKAKALKTIVKRRLSEQEDITDLEM